MEGAKDGGREREIKRDRQRQRWQRCNQGETGRQERQRDRQRQMTERQTRKERQTETHIRRYIQRQRDHHATSNNPRMCSGFFKRSERPSLD